jgi:hypothetical protein|tara:strand:- start:432 stop:1298 length:867 start_codon:yes stop_codon:yes gene_type:complete
MKLKYSIIFLFLTSSLTGFGQTLSMSDIKVISEEIDTQIKGVVLDPSTGLKGRGVISLGRKLIYQYDVPEDWYPYDDIRQELVKNVIESGINKFYVQGEVDLSYYYFKNNRIIKSVNIDWRELRFKLGDYLELTEHPKSNGLEYKIQKPLGWEIKEGNGPHIVKTFISDKKVYSIYVNETGQFLTKKDVKDFFENETDRNQFINEFGKNGGYNFKNNKVVTIENYPFIYVNGTIKQERMGVEVNCKVHLWMSYIEDQFVYFMGSSYSDDDYFTEFFKITNSIKLLNQY